MASEGGRLHLVGAVEPRHPFVDSAGRSDHGCERTGGRALLRDGRSADLQRVAPVGVDLCPVAFDERCERLVGDVAPQHAPLAAHLLTREEEELFVRGIAEDEADAGCDGDRARVEHRLDVGPELVLGVVLLEGVPGRADAVLVGVEPLALALVAEHDADDQNLAGQVVCCAERFPALPGIFDHVEHEAEVDYGGRAPPRAAAVNGVPAVRPDVHRPKKPQIVAASAAVVEHGERSVKETEPEQMLERGGEGRAPQRSSMSVDR